LIHVQVPSLAPVRQIDATPKPKTEDEDEYEDDYDFGTRPRIDKSETTKSALARSPFLVLGF
jgi:hypothetical protein